jgi:hypothetical protein
MFGLVLNPTKHQPNSLGFKRMLQGLHTTTEGMACSHKIDWHNLPKLNLCF